MKGWKAWSVTIVRRLWYCDKTASISQQTHGKNYHFLYFKIEWSLIYSTAKEQLTTTMWCINLADTCASSKKQTWIQYLSAHSNLLQVGLVAGASWPPTAYRKPLHVATPTPPRLFDMEVQGIHLLVWGSKHSTDFKQELPSLPPTAYNL